jgi:hypothetical protein
MTATNDTQFYFCPNCRSYWYYSQDGELKLFYATLIKPDDLTEEEQENAITDPCDCTD